MPSVMSMTEDQGFVPPTVRTKPEGENLKTKNQQTSTIGKLISRTVKWLRAENQSKFTQILKKIVAVALAVILTVSVGGIGFLILGAKEWKHQAKDALNPNKSERAPEQRRPVKDGSEERRPAGRTPSDEKEKVTGEGMKHLFGMMYGDDEESVDEEKDTAPTTQIEGKFPGSLKKFQILGADEELLPSDIISVDDKEMFPEHIGKKLIEEETDKKVNAVATSILSGLIPAQKQYIQEKTLLFGASKGESPTDIPKVDPASLIKPQQVGNCTYVFPTGTLAGRKVSVLSPLAAAEQIGSAFHSTMGYSATPWEKANAEFLPEQKKKISEEEVEKFCEMYGNLTVFGSDTKEAGETGEDEDLYG